MIFTTLKIKETEYKLKLRSRDIIQLEKALGTSPLSVLMGLNTNELPKLEDMITILQHSLQAFQHGFDKEKTFDLFDEYVDNGGSLIEFIPVILEVFQTSGLIPKEVEAAEAAPKKTKRKN